MYGYTLIIFFNVFIQQTITLCVYGWQHVHRLHRASRILTSDPHIEAGGYKYRKSAETSVETNVFPWLALCF